MPPDELTQRLRSSGTALLCSADRRVQAIELAFFPVSAGICIAGRAVTARATPEDNTAVHRAVHSANVGDVLVVDSGVDRSRGLFGDILGEACQRKGLAGVIVRGSVRDIASLKAMRFPLWSTAVHPAPATKNGQGEVGVQIQLGGVCISAGDWIVADDDGVVVIAAAFVEDMVVAADALSRKEQSIRARLAAGESTCAIFGIQP